ncbi:hypothetical protein [Sphingomonas sp. ID0503]|uniref:hypothetical protein n=1 Tax=Sphingomonas sp. ID0503 TaxID=3399691 RepID=UPI003AFABC8B
MALRFTEHGVSAKNGRVSTWGGITLFQIADGQLRNGWAEEDYYARKRQLKSGVPDEIRPPHHAPWDKTAEAHDSQTEVMVRAWLADTAHLLDLIDEISAEGPRLAELIRPEKIRLSFLFTAGHRAAFHGEIEGVYTGGFSDIDRTMISTPVRLPIAAIVDIAEAQVYRVQLCGDRLGLHRSLLPSR